MVLKMYMARLDSILPGYSEMFKELNAFFELKNELTNSKVTTLMWQKSSALDLWNKYSSTFPLLFPIVSYIYSIPVSSASVERLFSIARLQPTIIFGLHCGNQILLELQLRLRRGCHH